MELENAFEKLNNEIQEIKTRIEALEKIDIDDL
jgi:vacuolar-type H+-ATPase subunit D/Vma8